MASKHSSVVRMGIASDAASQDVAEAIGCSCEADCMPRAATTGTTATTQATSTTKTTTPTATKTTSTATVPTTTSTATTKDCRRGVGRRDCFLCNDTTGDCRRCRNGKYLLDGRCVDGVTCVSTGSVPVGDSMYGNACLGSGELCRSPGCKPPRTLGSCLQAILDASFIGGLRCIACDESFLTNGLCKSRLICKGNKYKESGQRCTCKTQGTHNSSDVDGHCHRCFHYARPTEGTVLAGGVYQRCYGCGNSKLFYAEDGRCILPGECPESFTRYIVGPDHNRCTRPFTCKNRRQISGDAVSKRCECVPKCKECVWSGCTSSGSEAFNSDAGFSDSACVHCKQGYLLAHHDANPAHAHTLRPVIKPSAACLTVLQCIRKGGAPTGTGCDLP